MNTPKHPTRFPAGSVGEMVSPYRGRLISGIIIAVVVVAVGGAVFFSNQAANRASAAPAPAAQVTISHSGLTPATVKIKAGQSVTWTSTDAAAHKLGLVDTGSGIPADGFGGDEPVNRGETYSYAFATPGTYTYTDTINPGHLQGFVIVSK
jgi:plastocyanin